MTPEQFDRWRDFATRMAATCFRGRKKPGPRHVIACVREFFEDIDGDYMGISQETVLLYNGWDDWPNNPSGGRLPILCDLMSDYEEHWMPRYWDGENEAAWDRRRDRWCGGARCCIRAGLDVACPDGANMGVLGFTAGDIRRMYSDGVPEWIARQWDSGQAIIAAASVPGIGFVPEVVGPSEKFEAMPDDAAVWL